MSIPAKEKIRRSNAALAFVPLILAGVVLVYVYWPQKKFSLNKTYFSDDDGAHWYTSDVNQLPPYDHNGRTAVRAVIYSYAGGSKTFCGYLMRFPAEVKKSIEQSAEQSGGKETPYSESMSIAYNGSAEVKAPQSLGPWVNIRSPQASPVLQIKSPDGSELDQVLP